MQTLRRVKKNQKRIGCVQVTSRVFKVHVMVLEYAPSIPGTRRGFRVSYNTRRSFRVRVIVLGYAPGF